MATRPSSGELRHRTTTVQAALDALSVSGLTAITSTIPNFSWTNTGVTELRSEFPSVPTGDWHLAPSSCAVQFEFVSTNFFEANPTAHFAVVTRCDTDVIATAVRGAGAAFGDLRGAEEGTQTNPGGQLETWSNGLSPASYRQLIPNAHSPANKPLVSGVRYQVFLESVRGPSLLRFLRMTIARENPLRSAWDLEVDTGYCLDSNQYYDATKLGYVFAYVFGSNLSAWTLAFSNIRAIWGPAFGILGAAGIDKLSRYGDTMEGDLVMGSGGRKIKVDMSGGYTSWTSFTSAQANSSATVMVVPSGSAVNANFLATNKSALTNFGYVSMGMVGTHAVIETLGIGGHVTPEIAIKPGTVLAITFKAGQTWLPGAAKHLTQTGNGLTGAYNLSGYYSDIQCAGAIDVENLCVPGAITAATGSSAVEYGTLRLWAWVGRIIKVLNEKGIRVD